MSFSLLNDAWIPVLRKDGTRQLIRPWELTDNYADNPIETLAAPRADFAGAHIQFLIGLLQTATAPTNEFTWREWYTSPPSPEEIRSRIEQFADVFRLDGEYPRFMQDSTAADAEDKGVAALLIESPGEKTIKLNTDHFIKRDTVEGLCPACAASTLLTLQINAPSGGQGHRTSLRGGGPLSTILIDTTLWRSVWLNVLPGETFATSGGADDAKTEPKDIFPWMGPTRVSSSDGRQTTPNDTNPSHVYWATPRRIHLDTGATTTGICSICGTPSDKLITTYRTKNYGFDYKGNWLHPLSPYTKNKDGELLPEHGQPGGVRYKHWLGFIQPTEVKQQAIVVSYFLDKRQGALSRKQIDTSLRLFAFGYDMDNMKARCWYEGLMPVLWIAPQYESDYKREAERAINAAGRTTEMLRFALRAGLRKRKEDVKFDASILTAAETRFWSSTEAEFYEYLGQIRTALEENTSRENINAIKTRWLRTLQQSALQCFHTVILSSPIEDNDPKRIADAHNELTRQLLYYKTLREILDLPYKEKEQKDTEKKGKKQRATA
jgi:CRISPR system Cascade subunit CasA